MLIVIPSVGYADFLAVTLPAWQTFAPGARIRVVTAPGDRDTFEVASDAGVGCVVTDAWWHDRASFNKARALDEAFEMTDGRPAPARRCLATDADILPVGRMPDVVVPPGMLYGCARYACDTPELLAAFRRGEEVDLPLLMPRQRGDVEPPRVRRPTDADITKAATAGLGYFQLFGSRAGLTFGSSGTAGAYDQRFASQFTERRELPVTVLHLGGQDRRNWAGRVLPRWSPA